MQRMWKAIATLSMAAAMLTAGGEAAYFAWKIGPALVPRVLEANLTVEMGLRPGGWVFLVAAGVTLAALAVTMKARRN